LTLTLDLDLAAALAQVRRSRLFLSSRKGCVFTWAFDWLTGRFKCRVIQRLVALTMKSFMILTVPIHSRTKVSLTEMKKKFSSPSLIVLFPGFVMESVSVDLLALPCGSWDFALLTLALKVES